MLAAISSIELFVTAGTIPDEKVRLELEEQKSFKSQDDIVAHVLGMGQHTD